MALTHTYINKLSPSDKCTPSRPDKHSDGDGLQLWVRHTGNKVWISAFFVWVIWTSVRKHERGYVTSLIYVIYTIDEWRMIFTCRLRGFLKQ